MEREPTGVDGLHRLPGNAAVVPGDHQRPHAFADYCNRPDYLHYLNLNEVAIPSLALFIATVEPVVRRERHGLWQDALLGPALKFKHGNQSLTQHLESRTRAQDRSYSRVFAPPWAEQMNAEFDNLLEAERACFPDDAEGLWRFKLRNRSRLRTGVNPCQYSTHSRRRSLPEFPGDFGSWRLPPNPKHDWASDCSVASTDAR